MRCHLGWYKPKKYDSIWKTNKTWPYYSLIGSMCLSD
jgi:hypothetical protein